MKATGIVFVAIALTTSSAAAGDKVALEVYTGGKTDEAKALEPLLTALSGRGFDVGDALRRKFEDKVSLTLGTALPAQFAAEVDRGYAEFNNGNFQDAITILTKMVDQAKPQSGAFADKPDMRDKLATAYVVLALAAHRNGDQSAMRRWFEELLRTFPRYEVTRAKYGADGAKQFQAAKTAIAATQLGSLIVTTTDGTSAIYVNEAIEGSGKITRKEAIPGEYRVFTKLGNRLSRLHVVTVTPGKEVTVEINTAFDAVVQTSPTWTGLAYATAESRAQHETKDAAAFGDELRAEAVAVVGIDQNKGKAVIFAALVARDGKSEIRRAQVALDPQPSKEDLKQIADYIIGDNLNPSPPIEKVVRDAPVVESPCPPDDQDCKRTPPTPERPRGGGGLWGGWKFVAGGVALAALGAGGYLLSQDGKCKDEVAPGMTCTNVLNNAAPAYVTLGGGVAIAAITVYLFIRKDDDRPSKSAFVVPTRGGAVAGFTARF